MDTKCSKFSGESDVLGVVKGDEKTILILYSLLVAGHAVAQLDEALRYKPRGRGVDSRWCHWNFSLT